MEPPWVDLYFVQEGLIESATLCCRKADNVPSTRRYSEDVSITRETESQWALSSPSYSCQLTFPKMMEWLLIMKAI